MLMLRAMSQAEIRETIDGFVQAARRCRDAGFDGVEVWAAYHCLLDQFWTPFSNTRDDEWGGSLENRTRLSREICHRIRRVCGEDFIIGLAVSDEPDVAAALSRESMAEIVALHDAEQAMDYVTCGVGSYFDFHKLMPTFMYGEKLAVDLAQTLKGAVTHALVTAEAHIRTPENANTVLGAGEAGEHTLVSQMSDFTSSQAFRIAGENVWKSSGLKHSDVDHLMIYDAFAHLPIYGLEDLGFVGRGEGGDFIWEGNTRPGGKLPLNTNGGGLSYMHSGMYGMYALQESVRQMRGTSPAQVEGAKVSLCHGVGGMFSASGSIMFSNELP